jgi:hypothetical protein
MSLLEKVPNKVRERWRTAGRFADVLETEVKTRRSPLIARVVTWFNLCRLCQDLEEQMLFTKNPSREDRLLHKALLSTAIGAGEGLLLECDDPRSLKPLGIKPNAVEGKIESLRTTFEQWHTEINSERQQAVLKEVFGGAT